MMQKFTEEEITYFTSKGWFFEGIETYELSRKGSYGDSYHHYDSYSLRKDVEGNIVFWSMMPVNIDCDSGKYDTQYVTVKYKTLEDYKNNNPYFKDIETK